MIDNNRSFNRQGDARVIVGTSNDCSAWCRRFGLPWEVQRLGARAEYWFCPRPPRNGGDAAAADDHELAQFMHLFALNRGVLLTPFHNMALMCPATVEGDVDLHTGVFEEAAAELVAAS